MKLSIDVLLSTSLAVDDFVELDDSMKGEAMLKHSTP